MAGRIGRDGTGDRGNVVWVVVTVRERMSWRVEKPLGRHGIAPNAAWSDNNSFDVCSLSFISSCVCVPRIATRTLHKLDCENAQRTQSANSACKTKRGVVAVRIAWQECYNPRVYR